MGSTVNFVRETPRWLNETRKEVVPTLRSFAEWNRFDNWSSPQAWASTRWLAAVLYVALAAAALKGGATVIQAPAKKVAAEKWLDESLPDPTPKEVQRVMQAIWREVKPDGYSVEKYILGEDRRYHRVRNYVGATARNEKLARAEELQAEAAEPVAAAAAAAAATAAAAPAPKLPLQERVRAWQEAIDRETQREELDVISKRAKYKVKLDWGKARKDFIDNQVALAAALEKSRYTRGRDRVFWLRKTWWKYRPTMPYSWFLQKVANLEVESAIYTDDMRELYVSMLHGFPSEFKVAVPVDPYLYDVMKSTGVELSKLPTHPLKFLRMLAVLGPPILVLLLIDKLVRTATDAAGLKKFDIIYASRSKILMPEDQKKGASAQYDDVVLPQDTWRTLQQMVDFMKNHAEYVKKGIKVPRGVLLSGPPGTGKTLLARAISREAGLPFIFASAADFIDGEAPWEKIGRLHVTARARAPCFVFIDEIDALCSMSSTELDETRKESFLQLCNMLEGEGRANWDLQGRKSPREAYVVICATNVKKDLNPELLLPGRLDVHIEVGLPDDRARVGVWQVHSKGVAVDPEVDFSKLVYRTIGYAGADIRNLVNEAAMVAVRNEHKAIEQGDILQALDAQVFTALGIKTSPLEEADALRAVTDEVLAVRALHEAGHVLLAHLFPRYDIHTFTHLAPATRSGAPMSIFFPRPDLMANKSASEGSLKQHMVVSLGGRSAEILFHGLDGLTDGCMDDLRRVSSLARELAMARSNPRFGLFPVASLGNDEDMDENEERRKWLAEPARFGKQNVFPMTAEFSELFAREVTTHIEEAEELAMMGLTQNRQLLQELADFMQARIKVTGQEVEDFIKSKNPVMMPDLYFQSFPIDSPLLEDFELDPERPAGYEDLVIYAAPLHQG